MEGQDETKSEAPPDFSSMTPAQIRLWKRRQKMLKSGAKRMAMVGGANHLAGETKGTELTKDTGPEPEAKTTSTSTPQNTESQQGGSPSTQETPGIMEKASWEKKWEKAAEKAAKEETTEMPDIPSFTLPDEGESPAVLRQRKEETSGKEDVVTEKEAKKESKNMKHLRQELAKNRNQQLFNVLRTSLVVLLAISLVFWHISHGPFMNTSLVETKLLEVDSNLFDDNEDGEVVVELTDETVEAEIIDSIPSIEVFTVEPPMEGWLSIPLFLLCFHLLLHQLFKLTCPLTAPPLFSPSTGMAAMAETSMQGSPAKHLLVIPKLLASVVEDTTLFVFVFALTAAATTVAQ